MRTCKTFVNILFRFPLFFIAVIVILLQLQAPLTKAVDLTSDEIIAKIESNLYGKTAVMHIDMTIQTRRTKRAMQMESYSVGNEKSFIKITYPGKDKGITFLKMNKSMWQYVPRIEKIIKIPSSMMLQSWMGSDFTNDDLVRESSLKRDYTTTIINQTPSIITVELLPKEDATVVWGKIIMDISKEFYLPTKARYFDEDDIAVREMIYENIIELHDRHFPSKWTMVPLTIEKTGHQTTVEISNVVFDQEIDSSFFTKRALKRYSR